MVDKSVPSKTPFLLLYTGDEFLRRSRIQTLIQTLVPDSLRLTNLVRITPEDLEWTALLAQAQTPSLMGGVQVFFISLAS